MRIAAYVSSKALWQNLDKRTSIHNLRETPRLAIMPRVDYMLCVVLLGREPN